MGFNLSALFVIAVYKQPILDNIKYFDYMFCNEDEASAFAKENGLEESDRKGLAKKIAEWEKINTERKRVVVVTQGPEPVILAISAGNGAEAVI